MALSREERKKKVARLAKRARKADTKAAKAEARRKDLKTKGKKIRKQINKADTKKEREALREKKAHVKENRQEAKKTAKRASARSQRLGEKAVKTSRYTTQKAGTPGVKNDVIDPFLTADQIFESGEKTRDYQSSLNNLDYALEQQRVQTVFDKGDIDKDQPYNVEAADLAMAGRGLYHSSVRDARLYDIDATARAQKAELDRNLDALTMDTQRQKLDAQSAFTAYSARLKQQAVENALEASEGMEEYKVDPTKARTIQHQVKVPKLTGNGMGNKGNRGQGRPDRGRPSRGAGAAIPPQGPAANVPPGGPTGPRPNATGGNV